MLGISATFVWAQSQAVSASHRYERLIVVVPLVGTGTSADPRRPLFAPLPEDKPNRSGIFAYSYQLSDNKQFAIVEFVAVNPSAFAAVRKATQALAVFERGKNTRAEIERALKVFKHDFSFDHFGQGVQ